MNLGNEMVQKPPYNNALFTEAAEDFFPYFNGVCLYSHPLVQGTIQIDASLQGLGGRWGILCIN